MFIIIIIYVYRFTKPNWSWTIVANIYTESFNLQVCEYTCAGIETGRKKFSAGSGWSRYTHITEAFESFGIPKLDSGVGNINRTIGRSNFISARQKSNEIDQRHESHIKRI